MPTRWIAMLARTNRAEGHMTSMAELDSTQVSQSRDCGPFRFKFPGDASFWAETKVRMKGLPVSAALPLRVNPTVSHHLFICRSTSTLNNSLRLGKKCMWLIRVTKQFKANVQRELLWEWRNVLWRSSGMGLVCPNSYKWGKGDYVLRKFTSLGSKELVNSLLGLTEWIILSFFRLVEDIR